MMKIILIRHGKTLGNLQKRYIGSTDQPLCEEGRAEINSQTYPAADKVFVSPYLRCIQTAELIYPDKEKTVCKDLRECDFGIFENKNYEELKNDSSYISWLDSSCESPIPNGESKAEFCARVCACFEKTVKACADLNIESLAFVVHGGTVMAVSEKFEGTKFYTRQIKNGRYISYDCAFAADGEIKLKEIK